MQLDRVRSEERLWHIIHEVQRRPPGCCAWQAIRASLSHLETRALANPTPPVYLELLLEVLQHESWKTYRAARWPWHRIIAVFYLRATHRLSICRRDVLPTTGEAIRFACSKRRLSWLPHLIRCDQWPRAILHEIGSNAHSQGPVFLYFHGGGYVSPLREATHMPLIFKLGEALHGGVGRTFVLEYGLAPGLKYPGQLVQSACAFELPSDRTGL
jgi:hypothetical protein